MSRSWVTSLLSVEFHNLRWLLGICIFSQACFRWFWPKGQLNIILMYAIYCTVFNTEGHLEKDSLCTFSVNTFQVGSDVSDFRRASLRIYPWKCQGGGAPGFTLWLWEVVGLRTYVETISKLTWGSGEGWSNMVRGAVIGVCGFSFSSHPHSVQASLVAATSTFFRYAFPFVFIKLY